MVTDLPFQVFLLNTNRFHLVVPNDGLATCGSHPVTFMFVMGGCHWRMSFCPQKLSSLCFNVIGYSKGISQFYRAAKNSGPVNILGGDLESSCRDLLPSCFVILLSCQNHNDFYDHLFISWFCTYVTALINPSEFTSLLKYWNCFC